jgi:hypothetical protein
MKKETTVGQIAALFLVSFGIFFILISLLVSSSIVGILSIAMLFWGFVLFYITPEKQVSAALFAISMKPQITNIERFLVEYNFTQNGIYLPPKSLKEIDSSLVFVSKSSETKVLDSIQDDAQMFTKLGGAYLTPPGFPFCSFLENRLSKSFTKIELSELTQILNKLFIEELELSGRLSLLIDGNAITIEIGNNLLTSACGETNNQPHMHKLVGCVLSSTIACILAKVIGKPISITKEKIATQTKITEITYEIVEDKEFAAT